MTRVRVLSLFDRTGAMVAPWVEAGHEATIVDLQHDGVDYGPLTRLRADVTDLPDTYGVGFDIIFAFPPCTHLANSGARWFRHKGLPALIESLLLVEKTRVICDTARVPYMIENPVGQLSTYWRDPDHRFDPCDFGGYLQPEGDKFTKKTCLWVGGGFRFPQKRWVQPEGPNPIHHCAPGPERANMRSATPEGFARAVFEANAPVLEQFRAEASA